MRLPIYPIEEDEKGEILRKIIKKLESMVVKKVLAREEITSVDKAIIILKVVILAMFFELEISYVV